MNLMATPWGQMELLGRQEELVAEWAHAGLSGTQGKDFPATCEPGSAALRFRVHRLWGERP